MAGLTRHPALRRALAPYNACVSRLRVLFAWLLLLALPLQGLAAATMTLCQQVQGRAAAHAHGEPAMHAHAGHHASVSGHHQAADSHDHASASGHHHDAASAEAAQPAPDTLSADHRCMVCGAACHGAAIASSPVQVMPLAAPHVPLAEPFVRVHTRPAPLPDKPPRA